MTEAAHRERLLRQAEPTGRHLPQFMGLDQPSAIALGADLGIMCEFNNADDPLPERLAFRPDRLRLYLRAGKVVDGRAG